MADTKKKNTKKANKQRRIITSTHQNYIFFWGIDKFLLKSSSILVSWFFYYSFISIVKFELIYSDLKFK